MLMKKLMKAICPAASLTLISLSCAWSGEKNNLYQVELPVASQTDDLREQAVSEGLLQVLTKLTGNSDLAANPIIKVSLKKAEYYVQEYSYAAETPASSQYMLDIRYDSEDINRLLRKAGVAQVGEIRPLTLVWLAVTDANHPPQVIDSETPGNDYSLLKQQSKKYGIPIILPMMDMNDLNLVSANDIQQASLSVLQNAAKRYEPDAMLIGNVQKNSHAVSGEWKLIWGANQWSWKLKSDSMENMLTDLMNQIGPTLVKNSANKMPGGIKLKVSHVAQREDLTKLIQYLKKLTPVQQVDLAQVSGDQVELAVQIKGPLALFQKNATIGQRLILQSIEDNNNTLLYEWVH